jgi:hypothetical protein
VDEGRDHSSIPDCTRKACEGRELEEIEIERQAREASEEIERQDKADRRRRIERNQYVVMQRIRQMQANRDNHISAPPTVVSAAAIASVSCAVTGQNFTPSAVISSPGTTQQQQQQQQHELLHNSPRKESKTRRVVQPLIADLDLTSELLNTPLGIKTNGLDMSLSTPMRSLSGDDAPAPSTYAGIQQDLPPSSFFYPATTSSSPGSSLFSFGFVDLEEQFEDLSIADQQIVQPAAIAITVVLFPNQLPEGSRRVVKAKAPQRPQRLTSAILEAHKNMESGTAPAFDFRSPQSTLQTCSIRKSDDIETRITNASLSTRDGGTTDQVTSSHLEEDSDVSDIQVGFNSMSIVAGKKEVEDT